MTRSWYPRIRNTAPLALLTLAYVFQTAGGSSILGLDRNWLTRLYMLEFLAIHSYPFMMIVLNWRPPDDKARGLRLIIAGALGLMYALMALSMAGWPGMIAVGSLMVTTYLGLLIKGVHRSLLPELFTRGFLNFVLFMACSGVFGLSEDVGEWVGDQETLYAGLTYFTLLTAAELGDFHLSILRTIGLAAPASRSEAAERNLEVPTTLRGVRAAAIPLLASVGLAMAPYVVLPLIAGAGGRAIDEAFEWPTGYELVGYWYFVLYVPSLSSIRLWQLRRALSSIGMLRYPTIRLVVWLAFAATGYLCFLSNDYVRFSPLWTLDDAVWIVMVDFVLLFVLVPLVWATENAGGEGRK